MKRHTENHTSSRRSLLRTAGLAVAAAVLAGCGSTTKVQQADSVGKQLQELDESYQKGIITKKEYERLKKAIIREHD